MIHEVNLIIESRNATLDVEMVNIHQLRADIQKLRDKWNNILEEARYVSINIGVPDMLDTRKGPRTRYPNQKEAEDNFRVSVFHLGIYILYIYICICRYILLLLKKRFCQNYYKLSILNTKR